MAGRARNSPYGVGHERGGEIGAYHDVYGGPPRYAAPSFVSHQEQHDFGEVNPFCSNGEEDDPSMFGVGDRNGFVAYSGAFYDPSPSAPPIHHAPPSDFHHQPWSSGDGRVNQTTFLATSANPPVHNFPSSSSNAFSRKPLEQLKTHQTDGKHGRNSYVNGSYVFDNTDSEDTLTRTSTSFPISRPKGANNMFESNHSSYFDNGRKTKLVEENSPKKASLKDHVKNHMGLFRTSSKIHSGRNDGPSRFFSPKRQQRPPHDNSSNMEFRRSSISAKSQQNVDFANEIFVTINEISLLTEPTKYPPPSRSPPSLTTKLPKFSENKRYNRSQSGNAIEQSQNQDDHNFIYSGYEAQTGVKINSHILRSPENGVPVATSTTAAMKDAVKRAEGRSKSVNEGSENHYPDREKKAKKIQIGKQAKVETVMHNKSDEDAMWTKISSENYKPSLSMPESNEELHDSSKKCETEEPIVYDQKEVKSVQEKVRKEKQSYVEVSGTRNVYPGKEREHEDFEKPAELPTQDVWNKAQRVMVEKAVIEARKRALAQAREAAAAQIKERAAAEIAEALECTHKIAEERTANVAEMKERATRGKTEREAKEPAPVSSRQNPERLAKQRPFKDEKDPIAKVTKEHAAAEKAAVEKITSEVRLRAAAEAKARAEAGRTGAGIWETVVDKSSVAKEHAAAEKAAVEKITSEVRLRAAAEAKARVEAGRTGAGIWETVDDKSSIRRAAEARIKAERAAVERVHIEARQRAAQKAAAEKAANEAKERAERAATGVQKERKENFEDDLEAFFEATFRAESAPRERTPMTNSTAKPKFNNSESANEPQGASPVITTTNDLTSLFTFEAASAEGDFQEIIGEPPERRKARFEQHQRIAERAAKAIAEKNNRDLQMQREQAERNRISDTLDAEIKRWAAGKQGNLRALLSTLQYVLWSDSGWQSLSLIDLNSPASVKKAYRRAALCVHPDKVQQKGANIQQKYIAEKVFDLLKDAWNKFNAEELS